MAGWKYFAERITGEGPGERIADDLLLDDVSITPRLSGPPSFSATVPFEMSQLYGADRRPLFQEWGTALYAEHPFWGLFGGVLIDTDFAADGKWSLDCSGFSLYPQGQPYTDSRYWVDTDPLFLWKHIWDHLQALPYGDMAVDVGIIDTPIRIGKELEEVQYNAEVQPGQSQQVAFEIAPFKLNWFENNDMGKVIDDLAKDTPFDWIETHHYAGEQIRHRLTPGYPTIGRRDQDHRLAIGENVRVSPAVKRLGDQYASNVLYLGEGEGRARVAGDVGVHTGRPRRVVVLDDKSLRSTEAAVNAARAELPRRTAGPTVTSLELFDHPNLPLSEVKLGNEYFLEGWTGSVRLANWVRVTSYTMSPAKSDSFTLTVTPSDVTT